MDANPSTNCFLRFAGIFELDLKSGELRKQGKPVRLQPQPFKLLALLARHAGQLVTREEIRKHLWSHDTFVDFEQGLNHCIKLIRAALGDDARSPLYIETLQRRGYRFTAAVEALPPPRAPSLAGRIMLAVLPFENLGGDKEQEYFSDGLTEEMITQLGRLHPQGLGVIARTSAMKYKHGQKGIGVIGRKLGVAYILEGSVRRAASRVRISAQLIQVSDETHLWAESYERNLGDILALQSDVAQAVVKEIKVKLAPQSRERLASVRAVNPQAYEAYLKGRYLLNRRTTEALQKSLRYFEKAIQNDPHDPVAYAGLADSYLTLQDFGHLSTREATAKAKEAAGKALRMDETLAEAHTSLGHAHLHEFNWPAAEREFKRAIELNPSYAMAHFYYANYLIAVGRKNDAVAEATRAQKLDPVSLPAESNLAAILCLAGRYEEAVEHSLKVLEIDSTYARAHEDLGRAYLQQGMHPQAIAAFESAAAFSGGSCRDLGSLAHAYAVAGKRREAVKLLRKLKQISKKRYVSPYTFALVFAALSSKSEAFAWLEKAYAGRDGTLPFVNVDPRFIPLHSDRRFHDVVRRMNFPD